MTPTTWNLTTTSADDTMALGTLLGAELRAGHVVAMQGELGAGKTTLTKGMALGLDVSDASTVTSPTFVLVHEYAGRLPVYHIDLYRLEESAAAHQIGLEHYLGTDGVCVIEWADKFPSFLPAHHLHLLLEHDTPTTRRVQLVGHGAAYAQMVTTVRQRWYAPRRT